MAEEKKIQLLYQPTLPYNFHDMSISELTRVYIRQNYPKIYDNVEYRFTNAVYQNMYREFICREKLYSDYYVMYTSWNPLFQLEYDVITCFLTIIDKQNISTVERKVRFFTDQTPIYKHIADIARISRVAEGFVKDDRSLDFKTYCMSANPSLYHGVNNGDEDSVSYYKRNYNMGELPSDLWLSVLKSHRLNVPQEYHNLINELFKKFGLKNSNGVLNQIFVHKQRFADLCYVCIAFGQAFVNNLGHSDQKNYMDSLYAGKFNELRRYNNGETSYTMKEVIPIMDHQIRVMYEPNAFADPSQVMVFSTTTHIPVGNYMMYTKNLYKICKKIFEECV
jgi:hypothetical protein